MSRKRTPQTFTPDEILGRSQPVMNFDQHFKDFMERQKGIQTEAYRLYMRERSILARFFGFRTA